MIYRGESSTSKRWTFWLAGLQRLNGLADRVVNWIGHDVVVWKYLLSWRSSLHYWQFERVLWVLAIPIFWKLRWLSSTELISALSIYALYQNAVQRVDQLRLKAQEGRRKNAGDDPDLHE